MNARHGDSGHVTDLEIAAYIDRGLPAGDHQRVESHVAFCDDCRGAVVAARLTASRATRRRRFWQVGALAAAAVVVFSFIRLDGPAITDDAMRSAASSDTLGVHGPLGESSGPIRFVWMPMTGALSYQLRLSDAAGATQWTHAGSDTVVALPDSVRLPPGERYFWSVDALLRDGSSRSTGMREFVRAP